MTAKWFLWFSLLLQMTQLTVSQYLHSFSSKIWQVNIWSLQYWTAITALEDFLNDDHASPIHRTAILTSLGAITENWGSQWTCWGHGKHCILLLSQATIQMHHLVAFQVSLHVKPFTTHSTDKRFLACVNPRVRLQLPFCGKRFQTKLTSMFWWTNWIWKDKFVLVIQSKSHRVLSKCEHTT